MEFQGIKETWDQEDFSNKKGKGHCHAQNKDIGRLSIAAKDKF
jgi:hypothetical protein